MQTHEHAQNNTETVRKEGNARKQRWENWVTSLSGWHLELENYGGTSERILHFSDKKTDNSLTSMCSPMFHDFWSSSCLSESLVSAVDVCRLTRRRSSRCIATSFATLAAGRLETHQLLLSERESLSRTRLVSGSEKQRRFVFAYVRKTCEKDKLL